MNTAHLLKDLQLQHFTQKRLHAGGTGLNESIRAECDFLTLMEFQSISVSSNQLDQSTKKCSRHSISQKSSPISKLASQGIYLVRIHKNKVKKRKF
jgi:hypothetical protein